VLVAFDLESQESLFAVGLGRDNLVSTEDLVIADTMKKFKQAIGQ